jgi:hypothetical protein
MLRVEDSFPKNPMTTSPVTQNRFSPFFLIIPATTLIGALGASLGGPIAAFIGGVTGLVWGILVGFGSRWTARHLPTLPGRWLDFAVFVGTTLFGGSLFAMLLYVASPTPENVLTVMRPPFKGGFAFFVTFNSLMEWLVIPVAVFLNWRYPRRRRLLVACAVLFYLSRAWTYIYFVPQIFKFMALQAGAPISSDLASDILKWVNLSWIRCAIDGTVAVLFLRAASLQEELRASEMCNIVS